MSRKRFTQEQITYALRQAESRLAVEDVCRKVGICQATFFRWKTKYGAMGNEEIRRLRILEEENRKLKQLVADLSLDKKLLQDVLSKKLSHPVQRALVAEYMTRYAISRRRICRVMQFSRTTDYYKSRKDPQELLRMRLRDFAVSRIRYGYRRLLFLLRREGWKVNLKRVHRLYRLEGLSMRKKTPRRKVSCQKRENRPLVQSPNQVWSLDFMSDTLANGQSVRILTILDFCTRESIAIRWTVDSLQTRW